MCGLGVLSTHYYCYYYYYYVCSIVCIVPIIMIILSELFCMVNHRTQRNEHKCTHTHTCMQAHTQPHRKYAPSLPLLTCPVKAVAAGSVTVTLAPSKVLWVDEVAPPAHPGQ